MILSRVLSTSFQNKKLSLSLTIAGIFFFLTVTSFIGYGTSTESTAIDKVGMFDSYGAMNL